MLASPKAPQQRGSCPDPLWSTSPLACPAPGAQPWSSTCWHSLAHHGLGPPAHLLDLVPAGVLTLPKICDQFWETRSRAVCELDPGGALQEGLTRERGSQHEASPPALQLRAAVSAGHVSPFQLSLPNHRVAQPFCTREKCCHSPGSQGSMEQQGPPPRRMLRQPPRLPSPRQTPN